MAGEGDQGNSGTGQESGTGTQGTEGQEPPPKEGTEGQGQESGNGGGNGPEDISQMTPEQLGTYAAKLQKDLGSTRAEAAKNRTALTDAQAKLTAAEREQMSEAQRIQADLEAQKGNVQTLTDENTGLKAQVEDLTKGVALRDFLRDAGALNPSTAHKVGNWKDVKLKEDGTLDLESAKAALQELKKSDAYLFRRGASADAGDGKDGSPSGEGNGINALIRGNRG